MKDDSYSPLESPIESMDLEVQRAILNKKVRDYEQSYFSKDAPITELVIVALDEGPAYFKTDTNQILIHPDVARFYKKLCLF